MKACDFLYTESIAKFLKELNYLKHTIYYKFGQRILKSPSILRMLYLYFRISNRASFHWFSSQILLFFLLVCEEVEKITRIKYLKALFMIKMLLR